MVERPRRRPVDDLAAGVERRRRGRGSGSASRRRPNAPGSRGGCRWPTARGRSCRRPRRRRRSARARSRYQPSAARHRQHARHRHVGGEIVRSSRRGASGRGDRPAGRSAKAPSSAGRPPPMQRADGVDEQRRARGGGRMSESPCLVLQVQKRFCVVGGHRHIGGRPGNAWHRRAAKRPSAVPRIVRRFRMLPVFRSAFSRYACALGVSEQAQPLEHARGIVRRVPRRCESARLRPRVEQADDDRPLQRRAGAVLVEPSQLVAAPRAAPACTIAVSCSRRFASVSAMRTSAVVSARSPSDVDDLILHAARCRPNRRCSSSFETSGPPKRPSSRTAAIWTGSGPVFATSSTVERASGLAGLREHEKRAAGVSAFGAWSAIVPQHRDDLHASSGR